jgi:hypothetical protein
LYYWHSVIIWVRPCLGVMSGALFQYRRPLEFVYLILKKLTSRSDICWCKLVHNWFQRKSVIKLYANHKFVIRQLYGNPNSVLSFTNNLLHNWYVIRIIRRKRRSKCPACEIMFLFDRTLSTIRLSGASYVIIRILKCKKPKIYQLSDNDV